MTTTHNGLGDACLQILTNSPHHRTIPTTYHGLDMNDLAAFKLSVTFGRPFIQTLPARLGAAMSAETDAASRAMCRLIESELHAETPFVAQCLRQAYSDPYLLAAAGTF